MHYRWKGIIALTAAAACYASSAEAGFWSMPGNEKYGVIHAKWNMGLTAGETADFIANESFRGLSVNVGKHIHFHNLYLGLSWQRNFFHEERREYISLPDFDVSGDQWRRMYISPVLAEVGYTWVFQTGPLALNPFVRLGLGGYYFRKKIDVGVTSYDETGWHIGVSPALGIQVPLFRRFRGVLDARYHHMFEAGDETEQSYFSIGFGLGYVL